MFFLVPLAIGAAPLAHAAWGKLRAGAVGAAGSGERVVNLDQTLNPRDQQVVLGAIVMAQNPAQLDMLAAQYRAYPFTAYELSLRAWELRGSRGPRPSQPRQNLRGAAPGLAPGQMPMRPPSAPPAPPPASGGVDLSALAAQAAAAAGMAAPASNAAAAAAAPTPSANDPTPVTSYGAGPGWSVVAADAGYTWAPVPPVPVPTFVLLEAARLAGAGLKPTECQIEKYTDGTAWKFVNVGGVVGLAAMTAPAQQTAGEMKIKHGDVEITHSNAPESAAQSQDHTGADPSHRKPPFTTEYQEEVSGIGFVSTPETVFEHSEPNPRGGGDAAHGNHDEVREGVAGGDLVGAAIGAASTIPAAPSIPMQRPRGGWFVRIRNTDRVWPRKLAEIGSGVSRGTQGSLQHLADINPHLAPGGVMRQLGPGDEVNIPGGWAPYLRSKGFEIDSDGAE